jgi:uracil-DNA glycosylase family 4
MNFMVSNPVRRVPGIGPPNARIAIVGEAPGAAEDAALKPFVGPAGGVLEQCLHAAGLIRGDVYLTNVVKVRPPKNDITPYFNGKVFTPEGLVWVRELREELDALRPNIVVAAGKTALCALTGQTAITMYRGYLLPTIELANVKKCLPMIHPAACLYRQGGGDKGAVAASAKPYIYRYVITSDLKKAKLESAFPELVRPERQLIYQFDNVNEVLEWLNYFAEQPLVAFDIEVLNYEVSCISFSSSPNIAASIPIAHNWTEPDECAIWRAIQSVLGNETSIKVGQNLIFDTHFLLTRCGIETRGPIQDTMIAHSIVFPELPKSLGFLGSVYCGSQAFWKDMVKFNDIKENS